MFRYLYEILPTNKRLAQIKVRESSLCDVCLVEESNIHKFYYCALVQECLTWMRKLIFYVCGINCGSFLKILMLDFPKVDKRNVNSLCVIVSSYIACIWYNRKKLDNVKYYFRAKIIKDQRLKMKILGAKAYKIFSDNYCNMDYSILARL